MNGLLVTGSRSLVDRAGAYEGCREILLPLVRSANGVVVGDAPGPDHWAYVAAADTRIKCSRWCLDGFVDLTPSGNRASWWNDKDPRPPPNRWPLTRNRRMVEALKDVMRADELFAKIASAEPFVRLLCVGFVDPDSRTNGTDHTLRLARQAGIWCARYVWRGEGFKEES